MAIPFLAAVKYAKDACFFAGIVEKLGTTAEWPKKANPKACQDIVLGRCEISLSAIVARA